MIKYNSHNCFFPQICSFLTQIIKIDINSIYLDNKSRGKKILNTTFYPDQKGINKFIKGKSGLKGNKQVKTKNLKLEN